MEAPSHKLLQEKFGCISDLNLFLNLIRFVFIPFVQNSCELLWCKSLCLHLKVVS